MWFVAVRVGELTNELQQLRDADSSNKETIRHYDAELAVF